jgi:hypothetical protein
MTERALEIWNMGASYELDVVAWANEQAALLRAGKFSDIDIEHIADEIEAVGKSEQRELASRMAELLAQLLKWQYQPETCGGDWKATLQIQRSAIARRLKKAPSLKSMLTEDDWISDIWGDARLLASHEMPVGMAVWPEQCPWTMTQALNERALGLTPTESTDAAWLV